MAKYGMAIDLKKCVGCGACGLACKTENNTDYDPEYGLFNWASFFTKTEGSFNQGNVKFTAIPVLCNHCSDAPCVEICPVTPKAMYKSENGITLHNDERCIGCKKCQTACPYSARGVVENAQVQYSVISYNEFGMLTHPFYNNENPIIPGCTSSPKEMTELTGNRPPFKNNFTHPDYEAVRRSDVVEKCMFCDHRVSNNELPYCVLSCPSGARIFGDLEDPESDISKAIAGGFQRLKNNKGEFLADNEAGTQPNVYYINGPGTTTAAPTIADITTEFKVYPNPASSHARAEFDLVHSGNVTVAIHDFTGRKVKDIISNEYRFSGMHTIDFNVNELKTGMYVVWLTAKEQKQSVKLVVKR